MIHQYGVNRVIMDGVQYLQCIVTIKDDEIIDFRTFTEEQPFTEWVGGTIKWLLSADIFIARQISLLCDI